MRTLKFFHLFSNNFVSLWVFDVGYGSDSIGTSLIFGGRPVREQSSVAKGSKDGSDIELPFPLRTADLRWAGREAVRVSSYFED